MRATEHNGTRQGTVDLPASLVHDRRRPAFLKRGGIRHGGAGGRSGPRRPRGANPSNPSNAGNYPHSCNYELPLTAGITTRPG